MSGAPAAHALHYWAGSLLITTSVLACVYLPSGFALPTIRVFLLAIALLLLALGGGVSRNPFRGHPLGTIALLLLAVCVVARHVLPGLLYDIDPGDFEDPNFFQILGIYLLPGVDVLTLVCALTVTVQVARFSGLPPRWRWAPTGALGVLTLSRLIVTIAYLSGNEYGPAGRAVVSWAALGGALVPAFLGVLVLFWAGRARA